jgi:hypothetical protein
MNKPMYRKGGNEILCACGTCGRLAYVEVHGTTAHCNSKACGGADREFVSIPYTCRDASGLRMIAPYRDLKSEEMNRQPQTQTTEQAK